MTKLAFSTFGVPGLPPAAVAALAAEHGFHGVELRAYAGEEPVHTGLDAAARRAAAAAFQDAGVQVLGIGSATAVTAPGEDEAVVAGIRAHVALAADLGAAFVRVFPGGGDLPAGQSDAVAARRLAAAAAYAADRGVRVLLQTHGSHRRAEDTARVLGLVGHRAVGAVWDVAQTWLGGEQPGASYPILSPYLGYVQVKDVASAADSAPLPLGAGMVPLAECVEVLSRDEWDGWLCWEYEKRWYPQAAELPGLLDAGREHLSRLLDESA